MRSRNRVLSSILSCLTCLGSVGSAAKNEPAAPPIVKTTRKKGNGRGERRDKNAKGKADISPGVDIGAARNKGVTSGASTTTPGSGLSGRDIGFLAGGATLGSIGGYFLDKKLSGNGTKISDVALDKIVSICSRNLDKKRFMSFIEAIAHAKVTITGHDSAGDVSDVDITFDKNFDAMKLGKLSFHIGYNALTDEEAINALLKGVVQQYKVDFGVGGKLCFCVERGNVIASKGLDLAGGKFILLLDGLVFDILHRFFPDKVSDKSSEIEKSHPGVIRGLGLLTGILAQGIKGPAGG